MAVRCEGEHAEAIGACFQKRSGQAPGRVVEFETRRNPPTDREPGDARVLAAVEILAEYCRCTLPAGSVLPLAKLSNGRIVTFQPTEACAPVLSVTLMVNGYRPAAVPEPAIFPDVESTVSPGGRMPVAVNAYGGRPPTAITPVVSGAPTSFFAVSPLWGGVVLTNV